jgi:hypothetical protein
MLGRIQNDTIKISIDLSSHWNYIDIKLENRLQLAKRKLKEILHNIIYYDDEINNLELNIDEYSTKWNFCVLQTNEVDVVTRNSWLNSIDTFTMNDDKKYITFDHLTNKITL